jgi:hypothetical protein
LLFVLNPGFLPVFLLRASDVIPIEAGDESTNSEDLHTILTVELQLCDNDGTLLRV